MKVMMIDPWGVNNLSMYTNGICQGINKHVELTLVTNFYFKRTTNEDYSLKPLFFKVSEKMKRGKARNIVRGIEYIKSYIKVINELKKESYDVIHIQWLLLYRFDSIILKQIKKYCKKLVYTAHNVLPHSTGEKYIDKLRKIYSVVDTIILHGDGIRKEFESLFPEYKHKVVIQKHGTYLNQNTKFDIENIDSEIINKIEKYDKIFIFFGIMFYNKGVDRLVKAWIDNFKMENHLLIIAGRKSDKYKEMNDIEDEIYNCDNILYINKYIEDNLLNYLINKSDIVVLPYRHASMSGVVFTAAEFRKPVLVTNTGAISEYIVNGENSFLIENDHQQLYEVLKHIICTRSKKDLQDMGNLLNSYIAINYSWNNIGKKLYDEVYKY